MQEQDKSQLEKKPHTWTNIPLVKNKFTPRQKGFVESLERALNQKMRNQCDFPSITSLG